MIRIKIIFFRSSVVLMLGLILFAGCKKEITEPASTEQQPGLNPAGWVISDFSEKPLLVVWNGEIQKAWNGTPLNDTLIAMLHEVSGHLIIKYLDNNKTVKELPVDSDYTMSAEISDTTVLQVVQHGSTEFLFHLRGLNKGTAKLGFKINRQGRTVFNIPAIPVNIKRDTSLGDPVAALFVDENNEEIIAVSTSSDSSGFLEVNSGSLSGHIRIDFNDAHGKQFQPDYLLYSFTTAVKDSSVAEVMTVTDEPWIIRIKGNKPGKTSFVLRLFNGNNLQFTSAPVQVNVK